MMTRFKQLYGPFFHHAPIDCHILEKCLLSEGYATGLTPATSLLVLPLHFQVLLVFCILLGVTGAPWCQS